MSVFVPQVDSSYNMGQVFLSLGDSIQGLESNMLAAIEQLGNNPNPQQLAQYQYMVIEWQTLVGTLTNVMKSYGDTDKQVVNNIGA